MTSRGAYFEADGMMVVSLASSDEPDSVLMERVSNLAKTLSTCPRNTIIPDELLNDSRKMAWTKLSGKLK